MSPLATLSLVWVRVALALYVAGLAAAVGGVWRYRNALFAVARGAVAAGFLFQLVSLVETATAFQRGPINIYREVTNLLAFVIAAFFLMVYRLYSPRALTLLVVPLVCLLTAAAAYTPLRDQGLAPAAAGELLHNGWIEVHIVFIFLGYAALVLAVASGVLYLVAEHALKAKHYPAADPLLPSLETLDQLSYRSLLAGFPLLTAGLIIGLYWADALFGDLALADPTVLFALLAWCIYLVLLFARWAAGWRGRRGAYLTLVCFGLAAAGWFTNGTSHLHAMFLR